jgi:DNA polymerase-3 subunit epsilon
MTRTQLREARLKPAAGQRPTDRYWQGHDWVDLYDASQAVPMRPYRAPSDAQRTALSAGRALAGTAKCDGCSRRIDKQALNRAGICLGCENMMRLQEAEAEWRATCRAMAQLLQHAPLFLDTETSGLEEDAEIVELAVLDQHGVVMLNTLVQPVRTVPQAAIEIHGITDEALAHAPSWPEVAEQLARLLSGRVLVAHNAPFEARMLAQSCARHGLTLPACARWECTLEQLTERNGGRWPGLMEAMALAGAIPPDADLGARCRHRALFDAECCRRIVLEMAKQASSS